MTILAISKSGGHRILDNSGKCWYIPCKWLAITWMAKDNEPHFVK